MSNQRKNTGTYRISKHSGETVRAFVPAPLPVQPSINMLGLWDSYDAANHALGHLNAYAKLFEHHDLLLYFMVRKEALLSSQIEGTQSSFADVLLFEQNQKVNVATDDVEEVCFYVAAIKHALKRVEEGFPLSPRLLKEAHGILLQGGRGRHKKAGEFRQSQNWLGGTRPGNAKFVPPPVADLMPSLDNLEKYLHDYFGKEPTLIKAAISHLQFETIHPFLDGNGRLGRLLIIVLLCVEEKLDMPILYLSGYFKAHQQKYYQLLTKVREQGCWEEWLAFFFTAVATVAKQTCRTIEALVDLFAKDQKKVATLGRGQDSVHKIMAYFRQHVFATMGDLAEHCELSKATVSSGIRALEQLGMVKQFNQGKRNRVYVYWDYLQRLQ